MHRELARPDRYSPFTIAPSRGFTRAVVIPRVHALHIALIRRRTWERPIGETREKMRRSLLAKALDKGPFGLSKTGKVRPAHGPATAARTAQEGVAAQSRKGTRLGRGPELTSSSDRKGPGKCFPGPFLTFFRLYSGRREAFLPYGTPTALFPERSCTRRQKREKTSASLSCFVLFRFFPSGRYDLKGTGGKHVLSARVSSVWLRLPACRALSRGRPPLPPFRRLR